MTERYGWRPPTEIDKEPPKENPIKPGPGMTGDHTNPADDTTTNIGDSIGDLDDVEESLPRYDGASQIGDEIGELEEDNPSQTVANSQAPTGLEPGDWTLPSNVKPSEIKARERPDGKTSIVYGMERDEKDQIIGPHGHTVIDQDGEIDFARTMGGEIKKDTGE